MSGFLWFALAIMGIYVLVYGMYAMALIFGSKKPAQDRSRSISILVAARNEEANILSCLESLALLDYPTEKYEVLIGDDSSEDNTGIIVQSFVRDHPNFHYHLIDSRFPDQFGKQNVLAHLARKAKGEALMVTDADIQVHPQWAAALMGALKGETGMVSGPTIVNGKGLFAKLQRLDWMLGMCINKAHEVMGIPLTGVGNNMAIHKQGYFDTGGYEEIPFSITEDYKLFEVMCGTGQWKFVHLFHPSTLNISQPIHGLKALARQRKRWFKGGEEVVWYNKIFMFFNAILMPVVIASAFFVPIEWFWALYGIKVLGNFMLISVAAILLKQTQALLYFPIYELYYQLSVILLPINQLLPGGVNWKGRKY